MEDHTESDLMPSADLEERIVSALRSNGVLRTSPGRFRVARGVLTAAAGLAIFALGAAAGRWSATTAPAPATATDSGAMHVQRAGSEYVAAITRLSKTASPGDPDIVNGREAAISTLEAAAAAILQSDPADPNVGRAMKDVVVAALSRPLERGSQNHVIWY
jgi:hypothetical protein